MKQKITKHIADNVYPKDKKQLIFDTETKGLVLVVGKRRLDNTCHKSWWYAYRPKGFATTRIYLAPYPEFSVQAARLRAKKVMTEELKFDDPHFHLLHGYNEADKKKYPEIDQWFFK